MFYKKRAIPTYTLLLTMLGAVADFLRPQNLENQQEGLAEAKQAGKYRRRKQVLSFEQVEQIRMRVAADDKKTALAQELGMSRETLYKAFGG